MSDYQHSITVNASAEDTFRFVSDLDNLPQYLPTVERVQRIGGDRIQTEGNAHGHRYNQDGRFHADYTAKRMEWGSDGDKDYRGWLQVSGDQATCTVTVSLHFGEGAGAGNDPGQRIHDGLVHTLQSIQNIMEGKGGKVDHEHGGGNRPYSTTTEPSRQP